MGLVEKPIKTRVERLAEKIKMVYRHELAELDEDLKKEHLLQEDYDLLTALLRHDMETMNVRLRILKL
jgi:hypothetical protein